MKITVPSADVTGDDVVGLVVVEPDEARLLVSLSDQLQALLVDAVGASGDNDVAVRRLFPDAYPRDPELAGEWRRLSRRGLADRKIGFARTLSVALTPVVNGGSAQSVALTADAALDWVRGLGDMRLVIANRMGIVVDGDDGTVDEPGLRDVYEWLAWLQDGIVQVLETHEAHQQNGGAEA